MNSITYIEMEVHKNSITLCAYEPSKEMVHNKVTIENDIKALLKYNAKLVSQIPDSDSFIYGYEAGCLGC